MKRILAVLGLLALGGTAHAQVRITQPAQLYPNVVTTNAIANGAVTAAKLAPGAVPGLVWGSVTGTLANQTDLWAVLNGKASLVSGLVPTSNLGTGTASASTYLRGDGAWTASNWLTSASPLDATKLTGAVPVANGGTGATTAAGARAALGAAGLGANTFTGNQQVNAFLGVGIAPTYSLHVAPSSGDTAGQTAFFKGSGKTGVVVKGGPSDGSGDKLFAVQSSTGTEMFSVDGWGRLYSSYVASVAGWMGVGASSNNTIGQLYVQSGAVDRTGLAVRAYSGASTAPLLSLQSSAGNALVYVTTDGSIVSNDASKGIVLKSPNGKYWRITVGDTGTLATTDLGTSAP